MLNTFIVNCVSFFPPSPILERLLYLKGAAIVTPRSPPLMDMIYVSSEVSHILLNACKQSTGCSYALKWKHFELFTASKGTVPTSAPLPVVLDYLTALKKRGLSFSSIKANLSAITTFHDLCERGTLPLARLS